MPQNPDISVVVTVYNKAPYLPATIRSLTEQQGDLAVEYIFVDDVSTDDSLAVIEDCTKDIPHVSIVRNSENQGPSIRINQGVRLARGEFVLCFDSDDILASNALMVMHRALKQHGGDVIYGNWQKTTETGEALLGKTIPEDAAIDVSDKPLHSVLHGRFLRMQFMARRSVFLKAEGADERVFIQDESIPLRLAVHAKTWLKIHATVMYVPHIEGALSRNVAQLNHDRFMAHFHVLMDYPSLPDAERYGLYQRVISAAWKQLRHQQPLSAYAHPLFLEYIRSKSGSTIRRPALARALRMMHQLDGVRRA